MNSFSSNGHSRLPLAEKAGLAVVATMGFAIAPRLPAGQQLDAVVARSNFAPSVGLTRIQVEARFHLIDGKNTVFKEARKVKGVPRVLGGDKRLFTIIEINGYPEVVDVQVVSILDTSNKNLLEQQVEYDSLSCGEFANQAAQTWCLTRILNTNADGLVNATKTATYGGLSMTVKTYRPSSGAGPSVVSVNITGYTS